MIDVDEELMRIADPKNAEFEKKLIPADCIFLGAKTPGMKALGKKIVKDDWKSYISSWRPRYFEDYALRGLVIGYAKMDLEERFEQYRAFIPLIGNWAVCDASCSAWKIKDNEKESVWKFITPYMREPSEFGMRFGTITMLSKFIDDEYIDRVIQEMDRVKHDGYYLKMGVAWTLSVCFVKYPEKTMAYLKDCTLDDFTYNKTLQKIIESYRVDDETKKTIRSMKRKKTVSK